MAMVSRVPVCRWLFPVIGLAATLLASACTSDRPHRIVDQNHTPAKFVMEACIGGDREPHSPRKCKEDASIQYRAYETQDGQRGEYLLGFVEFDDQGWYQDIRQKDQFLATLRQMDASNGDKFIIVVYAHGWKHNASAGDGDVLNFQRLLE
jgi:hypothetical protein